MEAGGSGVEATVEASGGMETGYCVSQGEVTIVSMGFQDVQGVI